MKSKDVLKLINITRPTLTKYVKNKTILVDATINGQYVYNDDSVYALIGKHKNKEKRINISYSRVSTSIQKLQLKEQSIRIYNSCINRGIQLDKQIEDIKSGMDGNRQGFRDLCNLITAGKVELLIIENKDRLVRFGFEILESIFKNFNTKILVLNEVLENKSYEQELTQDLISIIHYFTMKSYSHRRKLNKLRKELEKTE